jgi:hypothetical protein
MGNTAPCRSEPARDGLKYNALNQEARVIVNVHREQARSYRVQSTGAGQSMQAYTTSSTSISSRAKPATTMAARLG